MTTAVVNFFEFRRGFSKLLQWPADRPKLQGSANAPILIATRGSLKKFMSNIPERRNLPPGVERVRPPAERTTVPSDVPSRQIAVPAKSGKDKEPRESTRSIVPWLVAAGAVLGVGVFEAVSTRPATPTSTTPVAVETVTVNRQRFERTLRTGGTLGATNFAVVRAPRMRGARDRGGGGGGGGGLTIESLAAPGTTVQAGDVVAVFESKRTEDMLDSFESNLAQTRRRSASQQANLMVSTETLKQSYRTAQGEAGKAVLELGTAEVRSEIQAEILALRAEQTEASARQLEKELQLTEIANAATLRSLEIDVQQSESRLDRTKQDFEKMRLRTPVTGLVVSETSFRGGSFAQSAAGDQVNPGSAFLRIVDLSSMAVFADVNQTDTQLIEIDAPVTVRLDAYPGAVFHGRVSSVGAMAVSGSSSGGGGRGMRGGSRGGSTGQWVRKVPVEIEIVDQDDRIKPDLSASADILVDEEEDALVIPRAALGPTDDGFVVWVQQGDGFVERPVVIGRLSDTEATVRSGLTGGEVIAAQKQESVLEIADAGRD